MARRRPRLAPALSSLPVAGMLIGGLAVITRGGPRLTRDVFTVSCPRFLVLGMTVLSIAWLGAHPAQAQPRDHPSRYHFTVEIEGVAAGRFREVSGLSTEVETLEARQVNPNVILKFPGDTRWPDIVLTRGFTGNRDLYLWATTYSRTGTLVKRSGSIAMFDQSGRQIARWTFENAWPVKWEGPSLNVSATEVAVETLVLAHEGLSLDDNDR